MTRRVGTAILLIALVGGTAADRLGTNSAVIEGSDGMAPLVANQLAELAPQDLVHADYSSSSATSPDHSGTISSFCTLVRGAGFRVDATIQLNHLGIEGSSPEFASAAFVGFAGWTANVDVEALTVSFSATSSLIHRCPTRPTLIGDVVGTLADGSTFSVAVTAR